MIVSGGVLLAGIAPIAGAQDASEVSKVSLIAESVSVQPGQSLLLGLHFELKDHWHIYWHGCNDTGFAPTVDWKLPEGVTIGPMLWPAPQRHESPGNVLDHVYEGQPTILVPVTISADANPGDTLEISGQVEWLACSEICLPGFGPVSVTLSVIDQSEAGPPGSGSLSPDSPIGNAAARLPKPIDAQDVPPGLDLRWSAEVVTVHSAGATAMAFYPALESTSLVSVLGDAHAEDDTLTLRLASPDRDLSPSKERRLVGVLEVTADQGKPAFYLIDFGADGFRKPDQSEAISRVRERVGNRPQRGG